MDIKNFLDDVCNEIKYKPVKKSIREELEQHIQDIKEDYIIKGMQEEKAEQKAIEQMGQAKDIGKRLNKVHKPKLDWGLLIPIIILVIYGVFIAICKQNSGNTILKDTFIDMVTGLVIGVVIYFIDYRKIKKYSNLFYLIASLLIFLPAIGMFTSTTNGVKYFRIAGYTFNTAIIAVPLFIISFAGFLTDFNKKNKIDINMLHLKVTIYKDLVKTIVFSIFSLLLIMTIPSMVNGMILGIVYLIIATLYIIKTSPKKVRTLLKMYGTMGILVVGAMVYIGIQPYHFERLVVSVHPELDPEGLGNTGMLQKEVLQKAKLIGEADTEIIKSNQFIIPKESNFTFIYLIGKAGIIPAIILIIAVILIAIKIIINSKLMKDSYGKVIVLGLGTLYILQSIMSILMNINLGIQLNINLPFVSLGGAYFVVNAISIAFILSIYRRKEGGKEYEQTSQ